MKILYIFLFLSVSISLFSQDLVTLKTGEQIKVIVLKISETEIEYHKFENQDGPIYSIDKKKVLVINYADGNKDVFKNEQQSSINQTEELIYDRGVWYKGKIISPKEIKSLYNDYPDALKEYKKSRLLFGISIPLAAVGGGFLGYGLATSIGGQDVEPGVWIVGGSFTALAIIYAAVSGSKVKSSVKIYNRSVKYSNNTSYLNIKFGITNNGLGLVLNL